MKMTIPEYLQLSRGEVTKVELRYNKSVFKKVAVFMLAQALMFSTYAYADEFDTKLDNAGTMILLKVRKFSRWAIIIVATVELAKCITDKDYRTIPKIISKYLILYAAMFLVPLGLDLIESIFK